MKEFRRYCLTIKLIAMKTKLLIFLVIGMSYCSIGLPQNSESSFPRRIDSEFLNPKADRNWEFVKNRLFDGSTNKVKRYNSDIRIKLYGNPTKDDSTIITVLIGELKSIITTVDVRYVNEKGNLVITFQNKPDSKFYGGKSASGIGNNYESTKKFLKDHLRSESSKKLFARYDTLQNDYSAIKLSFNDSIPFADRKSYIEYMIIQSLCVINIKSYSFLNIDRKSSILGKAYTDQDPLTTQFDERDKFLLSKLYSTDFQKQFKKYISGSYSYQYYMNFVNKGLMRSLGVSAAIIVTLLILMVTYKPIFRRKFKRQYLNYLLPTFVIVTIIYLIQFIYLIITTSPPSPFGSVFNIVAGVPFTALIASTLYFLVEKVVFLIKINRKLQAIIKVSLLFLFILFPCYYLNSSEIKFSGKFLIFCALALVISAGRGILLYIEYSEELLVQAKDAEINKLKELKSRAEIQSLHSRINPHFLYNSLNSIAGLAHSNPDKTEKMALSLSDLFRYSVTRKVEQMSSIKEEIDMVRSYLEIEQIRFGERLSFNIDVDKSIENLQISRFIIQPLVENAIKHGVSEVDGKGEITISVLKNIEGITISVGDNGPSFPDGLVSGHGLQSLYDLLNLIYGDKAKVNWMNTPEKRITVTIPQTV